MRIANSVAMLAIVVFATHDCPAQSVMVSVASGRALPGTTLVLPVALETNGSDTSAVQFTLSWQTAIFSSISVTAGPMATAAGKTITCRNMPADASASVTCVLTGLNALPMAGGVIANAAAALQPTATGSTSLDLGGVIATSPTGNAVPAAGTGSTVTVGPHTAAATVGIGAPAGPLIPGATVTFPVVVTVPSTGPAGLQWSMFWAATDISSVSVASGPAATAAGKAVECSNGGTTITCVATGLNTNRIATGVIANVTARLNATAAATIPIGLSNAVAASLDGTALSAAAVSGSLTLLKSLSCTPRSFLTPGSATCTVALSGAAPAAGLPVTLSADRPEASVPPAVTIASGNSSAQFVVSGAKVSASTNVTITAATGPQTAKYAMVLLPPPALFSLTCGPGAIRTGGSSSCTVTLSGLPTAPFVVALSANNPALLTPATVVVPAGKLSATFSAVAGSVLTPQTAVVTAAADGVSRTASVSISPLVNAGVPSRSGPAVAAFGGVPESFFGGLILCVF